MIRAAILTVAATMILAAVVAFAVLILICVDVAKADERPLFVHSDAQGNYVYIGQGACMRGPMILTFQGQTHELKAGQDWPAGCWPRKRKR